jgi:hypothetical protein
VISVSFVLSANPERAGADQMPANVRDLLSAEERLNDQCRGGSGDNPQTQAACVKRDALVEKLEALDWCYGTPDQAEYQKTWQVCQFASAMWRGEVHQLKPYRDPYNIAVTFTTTKRAHIHYGAPFDCDGTWTLVAHPHDDVYEYHEHITTQGGQSCYDEDIFIRSHFDDRNKLDYSAQGVTATAQLAPGGN